MVEITQEAQFGSKVTKVQSQRLHVMCWSLYNNIVVGFERAQAVDCLRITN